MLKHCVGKATDSTTRLAESTPSPLSASALVNPVFNFNMPDAIPITDAIFQDRIYENVPRGQSVPDLLTAMPDVDRCESHCLCGGQKLSTASTPTTPVSTSTTTTTTSGRPSQPAAKTKRSRFRGLLESMDRSRAVTFKRKVAPAPPSPSDTICTNCTCSLDPVQLSDATISPYAVGVPQSPISDALCSQPAASQRNKLGLRINASQYGYDPIYDLVAASPALSKLREFGFTYPTPQPPAQNKERKKRKLLIALIIILLVAVVVIIITNIVVAHFLISRAQRQPAVNNTKGISQHRIASELWTKLTTRQEFRNLLNQVTNPSGHNTSTGSPVMTTKDVRPVEPSTTSRNLVDLITASADRINRVREEQSHKSLPAVTTVLHMSESSTESTHANNVNTVSPTAVPLTPVPSTTAGVQPEALSTTQSKPVSSLPILSTATSSKASAVTKTTPKPVPTWLPEYPMNTECEPNQFKCRSGVSRLPCLYPWERCDGIQDCSDGSDEEFCDILECYGNFKCADGRCVSLAKVCNGLADCADGSDELDCDKFQCKSYEYRCPSGYCIPKQWVCDGEADCPDHREEYNCSVSCSDDKFKCNEGWCITKDWRCNGIPDCAGGEDELNCDCSAKDFRCENGGCADPAHICDGVQHCTDGSDEWNCVKIAKAGTLLVRKGIGSTFHPVCSEGWTGELGDQTCKQLGHMGLLEQGAQPVDKLLTDIYGVVKPSASFESPRLPYLLAKRSRSACSSQVTLQCEPFSCGISGSRRVKRIVAGQMSAEHQWPAVGILYHHIKKWACTATILAPGWVITSALCVRRTDALPFDWKFLAGSSQPSDPVGDIPTRVVKKFVRHPSYKFQTQLSDYDVMLVQLDQPLQFGGKVGAICLPDVPTESGSWCVTAGWGYIMPGGYYINKVLKHVDLGVWSKESCNSTEHFRGAITNRMLCAGGEDDSAGPCFNDEGSPLMCKDPKKRSWYLAGVLTSQSCGSYRRHPAVFADVFALRRWIANTVGTGLSE